MADLKASGRWVFVAFRNGSRTFVHESFVKELGKKPIDRSKSYEVFYCPNKKTTPDILKKKQGEVHNIDRLVEKLPEDHPDKKLYKNASGYYFAKLLHEEENHAAMEKWSASPLARQARTCVVDVPIPEEAKNKEAKDALILRGGSLESKRQLLESGDPQNKRARTDPFNFEGDEFMETTNSLGLMSSASVEDHLSSLRYKHSEELRASKEESERRISEIYEELRKSKEESEVKLNEILCKYEHLQIEYEVISNRETSEAFDRMHAHITDVEQKNTDLTAKYNALETEHNTLKVEHTSLKKQFNATHENMMKVVEQNLELNSFLMTHMRGFSTLSTSHSPSPSPPPRFRCSSLSSSISHSPSHNSSCSSSPISSFASPLVPHSLPVVENHNDLGITGSEQPLPINQGTQGNAQTRPLVESQSVPNVNMFEMDYDSYNPVEEREINDMIATCSKGVEGDVKLVQMILMKVLDLSKEALPSVSWSGRGKTKEIKKKGLEKRLKFFLKKSVQKKLLKECPAGLPANADKRLNMQPLVCKATDIRKK